MRVESLPSSKINRAIPFICTKPWARASRRILEVRDSEATVELGYEPYLDSRDNNSDAC